MEITDDRMPIGEEIDRAENYLVCCMFEEATAIASSVIKRMLQKLNSGKECEVSEDFENDWDDMAESAGMVFVQSLKQLRRTSDISEELKLLFGSVNAIPVQVLITGVCLQISERPLLTTAQGFLEEFLNNWMSVGDRYYPHPGAVGSASDANGSSFMFSIEAYEYLEVVELYVMTLLATTLNDVDLAISWVEKAMLPIEKRQELLRRLHSINSSVATSSQNSTSTQLSDQFFSGDQELYNEQQKNVESKYLSPGLNITSKDEILKLSRQRPQRFWWFRNIQLKLGNTKLVVSSGKLLMASLLLLMYYFTRKKQAVLKRFLVEKAGSVKKALIDLWQLAFSYQVNPLAAVQTLPTATRGTHR